MAGRDLNDLYLFVQVAQHGGFAAAGRALDLPKSTLSRRIQELEARLGARLLQRTSRRFVVTEVGREFLRHAKAMLDAADAAESSVKSRLAEPSGVVRFTVPAGMAPLLAPLLPRFLERHPKVELEQHVSNRLVDLVEEGFDLALRGHCGPLPDSGLIERRLVATPWILAASPSYLARAGAPETPRDLESHAALVLGSPGAAGSSERWSLRRAGSGGDGGVRAGTAASTRAEAAAVASAAAPAGAGAGAAMVASAGAAASTWAAARDDRAARARAAEKAGTQAAAAEETVVPRPRLRSDDVQTLKAAAIGGAGIVALPEYLCRKEIDHGTLVRVLSEWTAGDGAITMLVPARRGQLPSVRQLMGFLLEEFPRAAGLEPAGAPLPRPSSAGEPVQRPFSANAQLQRPSLAGA